MAASSNSTSSSSLLQCFWDLSSLKEDERLRAAAELLEKLHQSEETEAFKQEINYCLTRLVSGLASNRKGARHGYFMALCELLARYDEDIEVDTVFKLIHDKLECIGNVKAAEERGAYFGQLFALLALIQSQRPLSPNETGTLVRKLMIIHSKKVPLREVCSAILLRLLEQLHESSEVMANNVLPCLGLDCGWDDCSPNTLLILLSLQRNFGQETWYTEMISSYWSSSTGNILSTDNFERMASVLLVSSQSHPRIHGVWPRLFDCLRGTNEWVSFWGVVIEGSLLISTRERKFLVYQLIEKLILPSIRPEEVGVVFSPSLFRQIHTCTKVEQHSLYESSKHLLNELVRCALGSPVLCVGAWLQFIKSGSQFPEIIAKLKSNLSAGGVAKYVNYLVTKGTSSMSNLAVLEQSTLLLKHLPRELKGTDWLCPLTEFILIRAHCRQVGVVVKEEERKQYHLKLISLLNELTQLKTDQHGVAFWSVAMVTNIQELLMSAGGGVELCNEMTSSEQEVWEEVFELINEDRSGESIDILFIHLLSVLALEMIWERELATSSIKELILCYEQMRTALTQKRKTPKRKKKSKEPEWIDMLMDTILSLLSRQQTLLPSVVEKHFHLVIPHLTKDSFQLLVKALEPQNIEELMEDESKGEEEQEEDDESKEEDSDEEDESSNHQFFDPSAEFVAKVRDALGDMAAVDSDQESVSSMDEEEMETLDEALSAIFSSHQKRPDRKKQKKADETTMMHFKMRILHLVQLFIRHSSTDPLVLDLLQPLFLLSIQYQTHKILSPLSTKASSVLEKLCKVKKYPRDNTDVVYLHQFLEDLLTVHIYKAKKTSTPIINMTALFLIKILRGTSPPSVVSPIATRSARKRKRTEAATPQFGVLKIDQLISWCNNALSHMITMKNSNVPEMFFQELCTRYPDIGLMLMPCLETAVSKPGNHFRLMLGNKLISRINQTNC